MTKVRCLLCLDKAIAQAVLEKTDILSVEEAEKKVPYQIQSAILAKNDMEEMGLLGREMVKHLQAHHQKDLEKVAILAVHWNGFNVMKFFEAQNQDGLFETEKEKMRDQLCEEVMMYAREDDDDDTDDDEDDEEFEDEDEGEEIALKQINLQLGKEDLRDTIERDQKEPK